MRGLRWDNAACKAATDSQRSMGATRISRLLPLNPAVRQAISEVLSSFVEHLADSNVFSERKGDASFFLLAGRFTQFKT